MNEIDKAEYMLFKTNVNQYQMSKDINISQSALSQFKSGRRDIRNASFNTIVKLADYYDSIYKQRSL